MIKVGNRINEKQLAEQLGISRAPVREAMRSLQQLGLVEITKNRGVFVRSVNLKQVVDIFNIRARLAGLAASEAARRMDRHCSDTLSSLVEQMQATSAAEEYLPLNLEYHRQIFLMSDNERLASLDVSLGKELRLFRLRGLRSTNGMRTSNDEHLTILNALRDRNPELSGRLFEQHVLAGRDRFLSTIEKQEEPVRRPRGRPRKIIS